MIFLTIHKISYYKVRVSTGSVETRWLGGILFNGLPSVPALFLFSNPTKFSASLQALQGRAPEYNGFKSILLTNLRWDMPDFFEIGHPIFFFLGYFC